MQSGLMKTKKWVLEFIVHNEQTNPLMGWQSSSNTLLTYKTDNRGVAQPGSASGLGPEGRRFKSCRPDQ